MICVKPIINPVKFAHHLFTTPMRKTSVVCGAIALMVSGLIACSKNDSTPTTASTASGPYQNCKIATETVRNPSTTGTESLTLNGQVIRVAKSLETSNTYDGQGRLVAQRITNLSSNVTANNTYTYQSGILVRSYTTSDGKSGTVTNTLTSDGYIQSSGNPATITYAYNADGYQIEQKSSSYTISQGIQNGNVVKWRFTGSDGTWETDTLQYDLTHVGTPASTTFNGKANRNLESYTQRNIFSGRLISYGITARYEFDGQGRVSRKIETVDGASVPSIITDYTYGCP